MSELITWCFHSPRRLLAVVVALLALLVGGSVAVHAVLPRSAEAGGGTPAGVAGGSADAQQAVRAAVAFTRVWAAKPGSDSAARWRQAVAPYATADLQRGLALTDPASLPGGQPQGTPTIRFLAVSSSLVEVPLSTGRRVLVTVVVLNGRWLASDVQPLAGDAGAVSSSGSVAAGSASAGAG